MLLIVAFIAVSGCSGAGSAPVSSQEDREMITITDSLGRTVTVPKDPASVVCSGAGCLRYLTYLQEQDRIVGVDDIELRETVFDARPYALANPEFRALPLIGEFRGNDDPEKIAVLAPDIIFKTFVESPKDADELSAKTGVPVVALAYGDLGTYRDDMYASLRLMATVLDAEERGEAVIAFFDARIADLEERTADIPADQKKTVYIGGIAYRGPHGFQSTEPLYPPFLFLSANNAAAEAGTTHADVAKEKIVEWDPDILFVDLSTLQTNPSAIDELGTDPAYLGLTAVKTGKVYGVLPYNWYTQNHGSVIADAYYIGTVLYPDRFADVDPAAEADEIYTFLVEKPVFSEMNELFSGYVFTRLSPTA
jgi:iron complex transport system substrate-binding protein